MKLPIIDAHIHLEVYEAAEQQRVIRELADNRVEGLVAVSNHLASAEKTLELATEDNRIHPAFGWHPEQSLPSEEELAKLLAFIHKHSSKMAAVGEVGLPYYLRKEKPEIPIAPYLELLEVFIGLAVELDKPVVLHAVYDDAPLVCDLLEKYSIERAHFHWFKGDTAITKRIISNGYKISVTPDCLYEQEIQDLIRQIPLEKLMVETDGPWPFEGTFQDKLTHPYMIHSSIRQVAELKTVPVEHVYQQLYRNTKDFYKI